MKQINDYGKIIQVPVKSRCKDGRKIPDQINLDYFMQMNVYQWRDDSPFTGKIFVYNPFFIHPINTKSILKTIDPKKVRFPGKKYHKNSWYHLPRIFENTTQTNDPSNSLNAIILMEEDMPNTDLYFQHNPKKPEENQTYLFKITRENFIEYLKQNHEVFIGQLEQKVKQ